MQDNKQYIQLKQQLQQRNRGLKEKIVQKHKEAFEWASNNTKQIAAGAMGSLLLLAAPTASLLPKSHENVEAREFLDVPENLFMVSDIKQYLPDQVGGLLPAQENKIAEVISGYYGFKVAPDVNGLRLKDTYGYIGAEQHLMRYPGDVVENMAPGRGAFGYFAPSKAELTQKAIEEEKYYIAVQTFMADDYRGRLSEYRDFFKFRKMLVVNPNNGRAVVVVIGDSGPAVWTHKQLGGSPEVMKHLERVDGSLKGPVLYFFIDDPDDKIPLGPIDPIQKS
jgi:hypothetical protein